MLLIIGKEIVGDAAKVTSPYMNFGSQTRQKRYGAKIAS